MPRRLALAFAMLFLAALGCARQAEVEVARAEASAVVNPAPAKPARLPVAPMPHLPGERIDGPDLTDPGLDFKIEPALPDIERLDNKAVEPPVVPDPIGLPDPPIGVPGVEPIPPGVIGGLDDLKPAAFAGRTGATKKKLLKEAGASQDSEVAVALGLIWLAKQQKQDGSWAFDQGKKEETVAATGLALLPFLAAGETHKDAIGKYRDVVKNGVNWLVKKCPVNGAKAGQMTTDAYAQAIGTLALCEAYGMTKDPAIKPYAQAAINYIQKAQGANGSWGYTAGQNGDTSIVGWQIQALQAAKLSNDLKVDDKVLKNAIKFLDSAAKGEKKSMYGYGDSAGAAPGTSLTSVGLLCRYYIDGWGPTHAGLADGVTGLMKNPPAGKGGLKNLYYYYYATQVAHFYEGEDWRTWNEGPKAADGSRKGGLRDWLVAEQITKDGDKGSWDPENGYIGTSCGRLGTTALCLLNLEVYYRHLPLYKRAADGKDAKIIDDKK